MMDRRSFLGVTVGLVGLSKTDLNGRQRAVDISTVRVTEQGEGGPLPSHQQDGQGYLYARMSIPGPVLYGAQARLTAHINTELNGCQRDFTTLVLDHVERRRPWVFLGPNRGWIQQDFMDGAMRTDPTGGQLRVWKLGIMEDHGRLLTRVQSHDIFEMVLFLYGHVGSTGHTPDALREMVGALVALAASKMVDECKQLRGELG